jgi:hypothetical protein
MSNSLPSPSLIVRAVVSAFPQIRPHLSPAALKAAGGYDGIRYLMSAAVFDAVEGYLSGGGNITTYKAAMATAVAQAYVEAADAGYEEGGGELPLDADTAAWARAQLDAQLAYVDGLFETLKDLRKEDDVDASGEAERRADGWARSLDAFYAGALMRGSENITLEFGGSDGKESCKDCQRMMGKRHKISYILAHNLMPAPGNDTFECKGYECNHYWFNPKTGERFTA